MTITDIFSSFIAWLKSLTSEDDTGKVQSSMRAVFVYGSFAVIATFLLLFIWAQHTAGPGKMAEIPTSTGWTIVGILGALGGSKMCQAVFGEKGGPTPPSS